MLNAGLYYITSSGNIEKIDKAKNIFKKACIGLVIVLSAGVLTAVLAHAYGTPSYTLNQHLPSINSIKTGSTSLGLVDVLIKAITGVLQNIVQSIGKPFINALNFFTQQTPLMAANPSVFNLWLIITAVADALFVLALCLVGFNIMSASSLGLEEIDIKHLLPQAVLIFLLINSSIFAIDAVISLSNGLIDALKAGVGNINVWTILSDITNKSGGAGLATLLIMIVFLVLAFTLLVYYVGRIVTLYLGAVLSPLLLLLWLLPSFKDFASSAAKTYIVTIFVLFIHVVILILAASIFSSLNQSGSSTSSIMALIVGMSTLIALIKTQGVLAQMNYATIGPKSIRRLSTQFIHSFSNSGLDYKAG